MSSDPCQSSQKPASQNDGSQSAPFAGHIKPVWRRNYLRLVELRQSLEMRQGRLAEAADRFTLEQEAISEIEQALNRIREGTYGICELTGEQIEPERLEAIPWTRYSAYGQELLEREGAMDQIQAASRAVEEMEAEEAAVKA